jgi:hypothetical protein
MQAPGMRGFAFLLCVFPFLLSAGLSQNTEVGADPSLRQLQTVEKHKELTAPSHVVTELPTKKILDYYPELKGFVPATSQDELTSLLAKVGANEDLLLNSIPNLSSQEDVIRESLDTRGRVQGSPFTGHYSYLILAHVKGEGIRFNEGRTEANWQHTGPIVFNDFSLTKGFALFALQFHPLHQTAATFRYLGRQVLDNRQCYIVAFVQDPERSQLAGRAMVNGHQYPIAYQGIAWVEPDNFQIIRMRIDMLKPRPEVGSQMMDIQLSEVRSPVVTKPLWLPHDVVVTRPVSGGTLREKHQFSDYRVVRPTDTEPSPQSSAEKPR